jgi:hypothetical protein
MHKPLPFAEHPGAVPYPRMELIHYASFCVELAMAPADGRQAVLLRYRAASEASVVALDEHWRGVFKASPEKRAEFDRLREQYAAWLQAQPR